MYTHTYTHSLSLSLSLSLFDSDFRPIEGQGLGVGVFLECKPGELDVRRMRKGPRGSELQSSVEGTASLQAGTGQDRLSPLSPRPGAALLGFMFIEHHS